MCFLPFPLFSGLATIPRCISASTVPLSKCMNDGWARSEIARSPSSSNCDAASSPRATFVVDIVNSSGGGAGVGRAGAMGTGSVLKGRCFLFISGGVSKSASRMRDIRGVLRTVVARCTVSSPGGCDATEKRGGGLRARKDVAACVDGGFNGVVLARYARPCAGGGATENRGGALGARKDAAACVDGSFEGVVFVACRTS